MFYFDKFLSFDILKSDKLKVRHFFTTRNFILKTKEVDKIEEANINRELLKKEFNLKALITPSQRHTTNIEVISSGETKYEDTDGLILAEKNIGIFLNFADCTPIVFYDNKNNIGAISHAGWRGSAGEIAKLTVEKMKKEFNSNPCNITAIIGPCICYDCFETSEEIAIKLSKTIKNGKKYIRQAGEKYFADLKEINKEQLIATGVQTIDVAPFCTFCNNDKFYSYRKENKTTNRMSAFIAL